MNGSKKSISWRIMGIAVLIITCLLPEAAFAFNILNPPAISQGTDLSIGYLQDIFGVVDGVLHGSASQIMGHMFAVFNGGALALGGIIVIYTTLISTMNTAHEGEVMGRRWSSMWIPIRSAAGVALLLPKATGYSMIQIFMMWAIVQGIGIADSVWDSALQYLAGGGVVVEQSLIAPQGVALNASNVFRSEACMYAIQNSLQQARTNFIRNNPQQTAPAPLPLLSSTITPIRRGQSTVHFPGDASLCPVTNPTCNNNLKGICGKLSWPPAPPKVPNLGGISINELTMAMTRAVQQMVMDLEGPAQAAVNARLNIGDREDQQNLTDVLSLSLFQNVASDYQSFITPLERAIVGGGGANPIFLAMATAASKQGWLTAGSYYQDLTSTNARIQRLPIFQPLITTSNTDILNNLKNFNFPAWVPDSYVDAIKALFSPNGQINQFITAANSLGPATGKHGWVPPTPSINIGGYGAGATATVIQGLLGPIIGPMVNIFTSFMQLATAQSNNSNPVVLLATMGSNIIALIAYWWIVGAVSIGTVSGVLGAIPCVTLSSAVTSILLWFVPLLWAILGALFVTGASMAFYIPLIPFILFLFGAFGWYVNVIEAMVAAPLVALGITHPEGHEVLGKADPAVLLLVSVVLTPSMMIIGFIGGIIMSYVGIWILNVGFFKAVATALFVNISGVTWLFAIPAILIIYVTIVIAMLNQAFALIHVIPDKVMRWLGSTAAGVGEGARQALGEVKGGFESGMGTLGKGLSEASQAAGKRADQMAKGATKGAVGAASSAMSGDVGGAASSALQLGEGSGGGDGGGDGGGGGGGGGAAVGAVVQVASVAAAA